MDTYYSHEVNEGDIVWFQRAAKKKKKKKKTSTLQQMTDSPRLTVAINLTLVDRLVQSQ